MGRNSHRKKERHEQRRKEKRKRQAQARARQEGVGFRAPAITGSNAPHRHRISQQAPSAWPGELAEDVAIFDDAALGPLSPELAAQATAVRAALRDALERRGEEGLQRVSSIPRESPFSEWRLFLRGLVEWLEECPDAASDAWKRLNPERRPGRIATVMLLAARADLENATPSADEPCPAQIGSAQVAGSVQVAGTAQEPGAGPSGAESPGTEQPGPERPGREPASAGQSGPEARSGTAHASGRDRFDARQLYHAKLLRRTRFDRAALRLAESGMRGPEEGRDLLLGPRRLQWLKQFIEEFKDTEPDLTDALGQLALHRAAAQPYADLFDSAVRTFNGPRHDRKNQLLTFFFYGRFEDDSLAERKARFALDLYLKRDLPQSETLSEEVRSAIASEIHLKEARDLMRSDREESFFDRIFSPPEDATAIREHLLAAAKAAPANSPVYRTHAEWIRSQLKHDRLTKAKEKALEDEIEKIMRCWSVGAPEEVEPRLWLVNFHLDNDELDEARPHVDFLSAHRQDDPRVRALPWKWLLLDAMRLCRKKVGLAEASARLDEAEALWPAWLPKEWLSYLRAAWSLRARQPEACEEIRGRICAEAGRVRDSLADACLMLGAAQQLRIPAADLKPLRAAAELALRGAIRLPLGDLLDIGSVFWDLHRGQLSYPAYRAQANQIGATFKVLMKGAGSRVPAGIDRERFRKAVLWGSECGLWQPGVSRRFPDCFADKTLKGDPLFEAARLNSVLNRKYSSGVKQFQDLGPLLRDAARSQRDAFYHHWFSELANRLDDALARESAPIFGIDFGNPFAFSVPEDDDDDDTDGLSFDPDCDCPKCRAAREAREQASSSNGPFF